MSWARFCHGLTQNGVYTMGGSHLKTTSKHEDEDDAEPERGRGEAGDGEDAHGVVDPGVLLERGDHPEGNGEHHRHDGGHDRDLQGQREAELDLLADRRARPHGRAEVEADEPPTAT